MKTTLGAIVLLLLAFNVHAQQWMVKENPEKLGIVMDPHNDGCDISNDSLQEVVEGVLVRARIRPVTSEGGAGWLVLYVRLNCISDSGDYLVQADFVKEQEGYGVRLGMSGVQSYGSHSDTQLLLDIVKVTIEAVITDYLKINFDLSPARTP